MRKNLLNYRSLLFSLLLVVASCKSVQTISDGTPSIRLDHQETRRSGVIGVTFPAGVYRPSFQTKNGVYYDAPSKLVVSSLGYKRPKRGGLFVPHMKAANQKQGFWLDQ